MKIMKTYSLFLLTAAAPDTAVICCSKGEPDEKEVRRVTELLADLGADVYLTCDGDATFPLS